MVKGNVVVTNPEASTGSSNWKDEFRTKHKRHCAIIFGSMLIPIV